MLKKQIEIILTFIIIVGIGILAIKARNDQARAGESYNKAIANISKTGTGALLNYEVSHGQVPVNSYSMDPYSAARKINNPAVLQKMAREEAARIMQTGDMSRVHTEMQSRGLLKNIKNK
jgi:hypothetical protein